MKKSKFKSFLLVFLSVLLIFALGFFTYYYSVFSSFGSGLTLKQLAVINNAQKLINKYGINETDSEHSVDYALKGLAASLDDDYAYYFTKDELEDYNNSSSGMVSGGIGVNYVYYNGEIVFADIYKGLAANEAGIQKGDVLLEINGESVENMDSSEIKDKIKGEIGTTVELTMKRNGKTLKFNVTRCAGQRQMTEYKMLENGILYICIISFNGNAVDYFNEAIDYGKNNNATGIIIDLRNNLGGDVSVFEKIADIMLPEGETFCAKDKNGKKVLTCSSDEECVDLPTCVIINGNTASAAEALTGALADMGNAETVGVKTFGKGIMQTTYSLANGGAFKLTTAKYYIPSGVCIHGVGITPQYTVELSEELTTAYWLLNEENDIQLKKAIEVLTNNS